MSHISCMLCGLQRPVSTYDPSNYDNELYLITKNSRGYAGGFDDDKEPILGDDEYTPIIKDRILEIVKTFIEKGVISEKELSGLISKTEASQVYNDKEFSLLLYNARLRNQLDESRSSLRMKDRVIYRVKSEKRDMSGLVDKLKTDYNKLGDDHNKLSQNYAAANVDLFNKLLLKDLLNYALMHFIKYCDAWIGGSSINDFKVFLMSLDAISMSLLGYLYQDLTVKEWCSLMDKIQGTNKVQPILDHYTTMKKTEVNKEYNKHNLYNNLLMFRLLKSSSSD